MLIDPQMKCFLIVEVNDYIFSQMPLQNILFTQADQHRMQVKNHQSATDHCV